MTTTCKAFPTSQVLPLPSDGETEAQRGSCLIQGLTSDEAVGLISPQSQWVTPATSPQPVLLHHDEPQEDDHVGGQNIRGKDARNDTGPDKERKQNSGIQKAFKAKMVNNHHKRKWGDAVYKYIVEYLC